jgi:hypothetical protein
VALDEHDRGEAALTRRNLAIAAGVAVAIAAVLVVPLLVL